jgi:hypothetical protein
MQRDDASTDGLVAIYSKGQYNHWALWNSRVRGSDCCRFNDPRRDDLDARTISGENVFMNKLLVALIAAAFACASVSVFADDKTPTKITAEDQAKLKAEAADKKAATATMTKEEKAAARKAANAKKRADASKMEKIGDTGSQLRTAEDAKATAASKIAPAPAKGTLNTPEAEKAMQKQKGQ